MYMRGLSDYSDYTDYVDYGDAPPSFDQSTSLPSDVTYTASGSIYSPSSPDMSMPTLPRSSTPGAVSSPSMSSPTSSPSAASSSTDWSKIFTTAIGAYGQVRTAEINATRTSTLAPNLRYPTGATGAPGYSPFPGARLPGSVPMQQYGGGIGGINTYTILGLGAVGVALALYLGKK